MNRTIGIHDGRTKGLVETNKRLKKRLAQDNKTMHIDDFIYMDKEFNKEFNNNLKKWKSFSSYRYVINLLCQLSWYNRSPENMYKEIEEGKELSEESNRILDDLVNYMVELMKEISSEKISEKVMALYPPSVIRQNLLNMSEEFFLRCYAPLLEISVDEINVFLVRVFKRDCLCNYKEDDFLLELAHEVCKKFRTGSIIEVLYELKDYYESIDISQITTEDIDREGIAEKGTRYIDEKVGKDLGEATEKSITFNVENYERIKEKLCWHKGLQKPHKRDRTKVYEEVIGEVYEKYDTEMDDYLKLFVEDEIDKYESTRVPITVKYDIPFGEKQIIRKGTRFYGQKCIYTLNEDVELTHPDYELCCVHVVPDPDNKKVWEEELKKLKKKKSKKPGMKTGTKFEILSEVPMVDGKPLFKNVTADVVTNINPSKSTTYWTKPKWIEDKQKKGFVVFEILEGCEIPDNICVSCEGYKFTSIDKGFRQPAMSKKIDVYLDLSSVSQKSIEEKNVSSTKDNKKEVKRVYKLEDTHSITKMEPEMKCVYEIDNASTVCILKELVVNPKRVHMDDDTYEKMLKLDFLRKISPDYTFIEKEIDISEIRSTKETKQLFTEYMYGLLDYRQVTGLDTDKKKVIRLMRKHLGYLKETMIEGGSDWLAECNEYKQRAVFLVLLFMIYVKNNLDLAKINRERYIRNFEDYIDKRMEKMRFDGLYLGYPIDCLLMFLLVSCNGNDVCDTLRALYKTINHNGGR